MNIQLLERSPGVWRLRLEVGKTKDGKRKFSYETVRGDRAAAEKRRDAIKQEHEEGTFSAPDKIKVAAFLSQWVKNRYALRKIKRSTRDTYNLVIDEYIAPLIGGVRLQRLTGTEVQTFYTTLATNKKKIGTGSLSPASIALVHRVLAAGLKAARKAKMIKINPMEEVDAPPSPKSKPKAINEAAAQALLMSLVGHWLEPIAILGFATGLRRGELLGLRWGAVDLDRVELHVRGQLKQYKDGSVEWEEPKTEDGTRTVSLSADVIAMLGKLRAERAAARLRNGQGGALDDAWVFTEDGATFIKPDKLSRVFSEWCDTHGLPLFTFHGTRHSHLTALLRRVGLAGAKAVSQRAGHADVTTTLRLYQTVFKEDDQALAEMSSGLTRVQSGSNGVPRKL